VSPVNKILEVRRLGLVPYEEGLALQRGLVEARRRDEIPDTLLLLQHPPVITLGVKVRSDRSHILATPEGLVARGVTVHESGRGGDVTFHGPGQLVGYPIFDLNPDRRDLHRYVRDIEESLIRALAGFEVRAGRVQGLTGVWVGEERWRRSVCGSHAGSPAMGLPSTWTPTWGSSISSFRVESPTVG